MKISLREITKQNFEAICDLQIPDEQQEFLSPNVYSLVESHYHDSHTPRAIYLEDVPVGFIMWVSVSEIKTSIWRFMVAHEFQGKGIGRQSLEIALKDIGTRRGLREIEICYSPGNALAKHLYASVGFRETGMDADEEEMYAIVEL